MDRNVQRILAGAAVLLLLSAFLWTSHEILSPFLTGVLLLYLLTALKHQLLVKRLIVVTVIILLIWLFMKTKGIMVPLFISFLLAYLLDPVADLLEKWHLPRLAGILIILILLLGSLSLGGILLLPGLIRETGELMNRLPELISKILSSLEKQKIGLLGNLDLEAIKFQQDWVAEVLKRAEQVLTNLLKGLTGIGVFLGQIMNLVLIPVMTFYLLLDFNKIQNWFLGYLPKAFHGKYYYYSIRTNRVIGGYIRGQLIVCLINGALTAIGLAVFKIPFAILLGVLAGFLSVIPYVGLFISLTASLLACFLTVNPLIAMIKVAAVFGVVQILEGSVYSPKIIGDKAGLHPVVVIVAIILFSQFFGFIGLLVAVPTTALIKFLLDDFKRKMHYKEEEAQALAES